MHTEEQAKELWCPMARIGVMPNSGGPSTVNDPGSVLDFQGRCIGSNCAMWRWEREKDPNAKDKPFHQIPMIASDKGYCGLAGRSII